MINSKKSADSQERQMQLVGPTEGIVRSINKETDQRNVSVFIGTPAVSTEPAKERLPLFMDTLYKARDFDPL
jgi:hypothetical protein